MNKFPDGNFLLEADTKRIYQHYAGKRLSSIYNFMERLKNDNQRISANDLSGKMRVKCFCPTSAGHYGRGRVEIQFCQPFGQHKAANTRDIGRLRLFENRIG